MRAVSVLGTCSPGGGALESSQSGRIELGDFGRRRPALERDDDSVCKHVEVQQYGNVTLALAGLYRLRVCALTERELAAIDPAYLLLVAGAATRRGRRI